MNENKYYYLNFWCYSCIGTTTTDRKNLPLDFGAKCNRWTNCRVRSSCKFFCVLLWIRVFFSSLCSHFNLNRHTVATELSWQRQNPNESFYIVCVFNSEWLQSGRISSFFFVLFKCICVEWNVHQLLNGSCTKSNIDSSSGDDDGRLGRNDFVQFYFSQDLIPNSALHIRKNPSNGKIEVHTVKWCWPFAKSND